MAFPGPASARDAVVLAGALSPLTAHLVRGVPQRGRVLAAHRFGAYLGVRAGVLPLLTSDAVALPGAVRLAEPSTAVDLGVRAGDVVTVGAGAVRLPGVLVRGVRTWRPARVRHRPPDGPEPTPMPRTGVRRLLAEATAASPTWLAAGVVDVLGARDPAPALAALVGRGHGLTPSGDDALAGALLLRRGLGLTPRTDARDRMRAAVHDRLTSTTAVSAALLEGAVDGWAARPVVDLVDAVVRGSVDQVGATLPAVLALGHTSGRDLVTGLVAGLDTLAPGGSVAA